MRCFYSLLLLLLAAPILPAQPVFPSWDEYRLSEVKCNPAAAPVLALRHDGSGCVFWDQAAQRMGSDGRPMGGNTSAYGFSGAAIALEDGSYAVLSSSRIILPGYDRSETNYTLKRVDVSAVLDSSPVIFTTHHAGFMPEAQAGVSEYSVYPGLFATGFGLHLSWNVLDFIYSDYAGLSATCWLGMDRWNPYAPSYTWIIDEQQYPAPKPPSENGTPLPMPFHRLSDDWNGQRYRFLRRPVSPTDPFDTTCVRLINRLSPGGALISESVIDTLPARGTDLSTLPIPSENGVDLLQRRASGGVLVERIKDDGTIIDSLVLPVDVRSYNGIGRLSESFPGNFDSSHAMLDLAGQRLDDGRILLAWSALGSDDSADVYIALFGSDWTLLGAPKRLNSVTTRHQFGVRLGVHGDSVSTAWLDDRDREWHVYYRCFAIDRVLSAPLTRPGPSFEIEGPWPHPASGMTRFAIHGTGQNIALRIVDALGRTAWSGSTTGSSVFSVDLRSFPPGLYFLHASTVLFESVRVFIVR